MLSRAGSRFLAAAITLALPAIAFAQEHAAGAAHEEVGAFATVKQGLYTSVTALVVFGIVFAVLATKVWPTITKALDERADKIKGEIEAAEAARAQAKAALEQYEKSLADARVEAQKEIDKARASAQAIAAEMKAKNDAEMQAAKAKMLGEIEAAKRLAISEIYAQASTLSTAVASKILSREINAGDQRRLVDDALTELKTAGVR